MIQYGNLVTTGQQQQQQQKLKKKKKKGLKIWWENGVTKTL